MHNLKKNLAKLILIGASLMVLSFLLSLMMTIRIIKPSFILAFTSCSLSIAGCLIAFYTLYYLLLTRRTKRSNEEIRDYE